MGKKPRHLPEPESWATKPIFVVLNGNPNGARLSAAEIKSAVDGYQIHLDTWFLVDGYPSQQIRARDILGLLRINASELLLELDLVPIVCAEKATVADKQPITAPSDPTKTTRRWKRLLASADLWLLAYALYCALGFAGEFFVTSDPSLSVSGIAWATLEALFKTAALAVTVGIWLAVLSPDRGMFGAIAALFLFGAAGITATDKYAEAFRHFRDNQLAPHELLVQRCLESGLVDGPRIGAICFDGWKSRATGSGACSHHGGVDHWIHDTKQTRTRAECIEGAKEISWL